MGKEAKFGLAIVVVLLIGVGGVVAWKVFGKSRLTLASAQANADQKENAANEAEPKAEKAEPGLPPFKWQPPRDGKEEPKKGPQRGKWNNAPDYRRTSAADAAKVIPPPPSPMPDPASPPNAVPTDPYASYGNQPIAPTTDPLGPPGDAAVASAGDDHRHDKIFGNRSAEDFQGKNRLALNGNDSPETVQPAPLPPRRGPDIRNNNALRQGPPSEPPSLDSRYAPRALNDRPGPNDRDDGRAGDGPYHPSPNASLAGGENRRSQRPHYSRSNEPDPAEISGLRGDGTYEVQPLDNFWKISQKVYRNGAYFEALEEVNRGKVVDGQLKVGQSILTPDVSELEKRFPNKCPKANHREVQQGRNATLVSARNLSGTRSYTVVEGDTLFDIARYELGKASRWAEIYELNRDVLGKDFDYLVPGTELALPEDNPQRPDPVAQRPGRNWRR